MLLTAVKVTLFIALMLVVGRRLIPWILHYIAHTGSRELFRLAVLAIALGVAFGSTKLFDVSLALGAFFAGMMLRESPLSQRAAQESLPLRDAFAVLFFVSVGMLFDPFSVVRDPWPLIATLLVIIVGKSIAAFLIVIAFRHPVATALTISASLAQIGEFSFILAELGYASKLLSKQARDLILAGAILSIMLNPLVFAGVDWLIARLERRKAPSPSRVAPAKAIPVTQLKDHTILVGYGRVGNIIGNDLKQKELPFLVIEVSEGAVSKLKESGIEALAGNAAQPEILKAAGLARKPKRGRGDPGSLRGRTDRPAGPRRQRRCPDHRARAFGRRGRTSQGFGGGYGHHGRAGNRARDDRGTGEELSRCFRRFPRVAEAGSRA